MHYSKLTALDAPGYIVFLIDASGSMQEQIFKTNRRKIDVVSDILVEIAKVMLRRSVRGMNILSRYQIALYFYNQTVVSDTNDRFVPIAQFLQLIPEFGDLDSAHDITNTKGGFEKVYKLLELTLPKIQMCPAPLIYHFTDGEYSEEYGDPLPVVSDIMKLQNPDGGVLVQNIYVGSKPFLETGMPDLRIWSGVISEAQLQSPGVKNLFRMSSRSPTSYIKELQQEGYPLSSKSAMLFPFFAVDIIRQMFMTSISD